MKWIKRLFILLVLLVVVIALAGAYLINPFGPSPLNKYQQEGTIALPGLKAPVRVLRDENGLPYIYADNLDDLFMAQGFVTAQDRMFQMETTKLYASGRICELVGGKARSVDVRMRTLGFHRQAEKHVPLLNDETRNFLQKYVDGVNAFLLTRPGELHLEFKVAGLKPTPWTVADSLTILYYMGWNSASNLSDEILAQVLVEKLGPDKAREIFPLNIYPDAEVKSAEAVKTYPKRMTAMLGPDMLGSLAAFLEPAPLAIGSNNWVAGPDMSPSGSPILANDPHLDARRLPGPWYPTGLIAPDLKAVGVVIPGLPGVAIGRTDFVAFGVTNAYADTQDLYVETVDPQDPGRYLEGEKSLPFEIVEETLKIKDKAAGGFRQEKIKVRLTRRGPVVTGVLPNLKTGRVLTMRWSAFEKQEPSVGFERLIKAKNVDQVRLALRDVNQVCLNFVFADRDGRFGWQVSGSEPIRSQGEALIPYVVQDGEDNWTGYIPHDLMPQEIDPERGWVGTTNHRTVGPDYPYYYTSHLSPSYRQRRLIELMNAPGQKTVDDHWRFQRDTLNLMAKEIAPIMARALAEKAETQKLAELLSDWDFRDDTDSPAPTVFQAVYHEFAQLVYQDELGAELAVRMLKNYYFWEESLQKMVIENESDWFDDVSTPNVRESRDDLLRLAGSRVLERLTPSLGKDPADWDWGKVHRHVFVSTLYGRGPGREWIGGGSHPAPGSCETLYRGIFEFDRPYEVTVSASLRMVIDLGDPNKILAVLPGGVRGRQFDPLQTNQIEAFMNGDKIYWWFSDRAIEEHAKNKMILQP